MLVEYQNYLTLVLVLLLLNALNNLRLLRRPRSPVEWVDPPLVSVLVPARNEERNIGRCVESLLAQEYPRLEVLVLDDQSSDATAEIVESYAREDSRVRLVSGQPLPPDWHGKAYACYQLARAARGDWLLFTDADTEHHPQSLSATVAMAKREGADLLSLFPEFTAEGWWERLMLPVIPFALLAGLPLPLVHRASRPRAAVAFGPFMLFSRKGYWRCGGHAAVATNLVDDFGLAQEVGRQGGRLILADGSRLVRVRMYDGLRELWRGISKSIFAALHFSWLMLGAAFVGVGTTFVGPWVFLTMGILRGETSRLWIGLPLVQIVLVWAIALAIARRLRMSQAMAFLRHLTMAVIMLIALHSAWQARWGGGTVWKDRSYPMPGEDLGPRWRGAG